MSNRAIISFANQNGNYLAGLSRLESSLKGRFDGDFLGFIGEESVGAPKHEDDPYAFKVYCWELAIEAGYEQILWLDASCVVIGNINPLFELIKKYGYVAQGAGHYLGRWCNDETLKYFDISRNHADNMSMIGNAGFLGLNMRNEVAQRFFSKWKESMEAGMFKGSWDNHRHDMSCSSAIWNLLGMNMISGDYLLEYAPPGSTPKNETIIIQAQGI